MTHHSKEKTAYKTTQTMKGTLHTMNNTTQLQLQLQLNTLTLIKKLVWIFEILSF
jgi:hypothetical protein